MGTPSTSWASVALAPSFSRILLLAALFAVGCSELGNPTSRRSATAPSPWTNGADSTSTESVTVAAADADKLLSRVPGGQVDHLDTIASPRDVATLVVVRPSWGRAYAPAAVTLATLFRYRDGRAVRRVWRVPTASAPWTALFVLPAPPDDATTALAF